MKNLCSFDCQVQCEEFYTEEMCFNQEELLEEETVIISYSVVDEIMEKIEKYQMLFDDAASYLHWNVDCDDVVEFERVLDVVIGYQEILDDLKSLSCVAEYFADEPAKPRYYHCHACPFTKGEEDVNGCTGNCALC